MARRTAPKLIERRRVGFGGIPLDTPPLAAGSFISQAVKNKGTGVIEVGDIIKENESIYYIKGNGVKFNMQYASKSFGVFQRLHSIEEFNDFQEFIV